jgi:2-polyprenyl-6-methoxyphenol hydroxylase-like FAD-dependent oxidoreductase
MIEVPVLIAGGGPVGTTLAMDLALRGTSCLVVEQRREQPPNPRCNTTNARSMEFFRRLGLADEIRAAGLPGDHPTDVVYLTGWTGHELTRYRLPASSMRRSTTGSLDDGWPTPEPQHRICQIYLEPILRRHARSMEGLDLREGWRFESYRTDPAGGVQATIRELDTGAVEHVRARFLVGAEGARSIVRSTMGASFEGNPRVNRTLSTFMRCDRLGELNQRWQGWMFRVVGHDRYHRFVAIDGGALWIYHLTLGFDDDIDTVDVGRELADAIGEHAEFDVLGQVEWVGRAMVAERFRDGDTFLAGDSAHIWIPMGGFGMNAGIADATNLSWKLTAVLDGWGGDRLLESYEAERKPMGEKVAAAAVGINTDLLAALADAEGVMLDGPEGERARTRVGEAIARANTTEFNSVGMQLGYYYDDSAIVCSDGTPPPPFSLGEYQVTSWPGARTPHLWLDDGRSLYDELGPHFTLVLLGDSPPEPGPLVACARQRGVPLEVVTVPSPSALDLYEGFPLVVVRPDQHVGWRGHAVPDDVEAIVDTLRGA